MSVRVRGRRGGPVTGFNPRLIDIFAVLTLAAEPAGPDLSWQDAALCAQTDPEAFFPEKGGSVRDAKKVCGACEVRAECLEYALENNERFGIWGGLSEQERHRIRHPRLPAAAPRSCGKGLHVMDAANTRPDGRCRACHNASAARSYRKQHPPGSGPGSGHTAEPRERGADGRFTAAQAA